MNVPSELNIMEAQPKSTADALPKPSGVSGRPGHGVSRAFPERKTRARSVSPVGSSRRTVSISSGATKRTSMARRWVSACSRAVSS